MKQIPFARAFQICRGDSILPFDIYIDRVQFKGHLSYDASRSDFLKVNAGLTGELDLICDISGEEYTKKLDESLEFYLSDGVVNLNSDNFDDVFECGGGIIDFEEILKSEIESIICDYHTKE